MKPELSIVDDLPVLVWRCARPMLAISSAVFGGGIGLRHWVLNAMVGDDYDRDDPEAHIAEIAESVALQGDGVGLLTAVDVRDAVSTVDGPVAVTVTAGIGEHPAWAAAGAGESASRRPGTINVVGWLAHRLTPGALVNAVATVAEAKSQALLDAGVDGTGTCTDATVLLCPSTGVAQRYGGTRSTVGAPLARAVHAAVAEGLRIERDTP